jgi:hypothetical protein
MTSLVQRDFAEVPLCAMLCTAPLSGERTGEDPQAWSLGAHLMPVTDACTEGCRL